jgi:molybdopterin/thiamine biosynthesis adenylyltransferase/rhodanese-related sulfurtransferase
MHPLSTDELTRYAQQIKLDSIGLIGQEKLKNAKVLCVGLGGLGSPLLLYLAAAGVGTLGLIDDDKVELSNLQRQILYDSTQVGQEKTVAASAQLLALNPNLHVNTYTEKLSLSNATQLIGEYDLIADGSDNFYTRYLLHDVCFELKKPYVYASASQFQGYCSIFNGSPCFRCVFPTPPAAHLIPNCSAGGVLGVLPGLLGMIQATEIIKWILNIGTALEKRLLMVDVLDMRFKEIQLTQNPDCALCVKHHDFNELTRPTTCDPAFDFEDYAITAEALPAFLQGSQVCFIDVRTEEEHQAQNMGGRCIPLAALPHRLNELDKHQSIVLYCQSGKRSLVALKLLLEAGFSSIKYLDGQLVWENDPTEPRP